MANYLVLKVGGSLGDDSFAAVCAALELAQAQKLHPVIVHGGGPRITAALQEAGLELPFVGGRRNTTPEAMDVVARVLENEVNGEIVLQLKQAGFPVVGVSGAAGILQASAILAGTRTGRVDRVRSDAVLKMAHFGLIPVVAPLGVDGTGLKFNVNADEAAAAVAGSLGADVIVFLTDVDGIYADWDAKVMLSYTNDVELEQLMERGRFSAGMIPKVDAVLASLRAGVPSAFVVDGRSVDAVMWAVGTLALSDENTVSSSTRGTCVVGTRRD